MEEVKAKISKIRHHDRVGLDQDCLKRIDGWIEQVTQTAKGVTLTRKDMVNWVVSNQDERLPASAVNALKSLFFNEVRFLQLAIKEARAAKVKGEQINIATLMSENPGSKSKRLSPPKKRKEPIKGDDAKDLTVKNN